MPNLQRAIRIAPTCMAALLIVAIGGVFTSSASAQAPLPQQAQPPLPQQAPPPLPQQAPPMYPPAELDRIVSPVALYPDPLLAQVLAATTFSGDIPEAARWADQHHYVTGDALTAAIAADHLPWDPSVQSLLPFPSILDMMASGMPWTQEVGNAFLTQPQDVMDAVQRMRQKARDYGYLRSNAQVRVGTGPYVEIYPVNPAFIIVPYYNPLVVFVAPRPGFMVRGAISFGFGVMIGPSFAPWGWGATRFDWGAHRVLINNAPWGRTWVNRATYVHPYAVQRYAAAPRPAEAHRLIERSPREREAARTGSVRKEEHKQERKR